MEPLIRVNLISGSLTIDNIIIVQIILSVYFMMQKLKLKEQKNCIKHGIMHLYGYFYV